MASIKKYGHIVGHLSLESGRAKLLGKLGPWGPSPESEKGSNLPLGSLTRNLPHLGQKEGQERVGVVLRSLLSYAAILAIP